MNNTDAIQNLISHIWEFWEETPPITSISSSDLTDFVRARLLLASCKDLKSKNDLRQYFSDTKNEKLLNWAIEKMQGNKLKPILAISSRTN